MSRRVIKIENVARLEGHASVAIYMREDGTVERTEYLATEPSRAFDAIFKGQHASEIPRLAARICGICYTAHNICACKALETAWETPIPDSAKKIRELLLLANTLSSHALHAIMLAGPGLLLDGANTIEDLKKRHPYFLKAGMELRMVGQDISELVSGRKVHTITSVPGGVLGRVDSEKQAKIRKRLKSADEPMQIIESYAYRILSEKKEYMLSFGHIETMFLALKQGAGLNVYDGSLELMTKTGEVSLVTPAEFLEDLTEEERDYSHVRHPFVTRQGPEDGQFRTGPLARIQNANWDNHVYRLFEDFFGYATQSTMGYTIARIAEMTECIKGMRAILKSGLNGEIKNVARPKAGVGVAVVEAPRGTLLHQYETDDKGIVRFGRVIAPTTFHQGSIERSTFEAAKTVLDNKNGECTDEDLVEIEQAIRAYDPCMSCAGATQLKVVKRPTIGEE